MRGTREVVRGSKRTRRRRKAEIDAEEEGKCCLIAVTIKYHKKSHRAF